MSRKIKRIVLTGPTGVLGLAIIRYMIQIGVEVYAICRPNSKRICNIPKSPLVHIIECDMKDIMELEKIISVPCDAFFHFSWAGTQSAENRFNMELQTDNIKNSLLAVKTAHTLSCQVFIGAGSQAEYGRVEGVISPSTLTNPNSGYGFAKLCTGQMTRVMCQQLGMVHIWTRIVSTFGINDNANTLISVVINTLLNGEKPSLTKGEQIWDYLYAGDAARAFYRLAEDGHDGSIYVIGSGQTKTLKEFAEIIRDEINPSLPLGFGERAYYKDQAMHLEADITALTNDIGWKPEISFAEGIREILMEMTSHE